CYAAPLRAEIYTLSLHDALPILAMLARRLLGWAASARLRVTTGSRALLADATLAQVERDGAGATSQLVDTAPDDVAALLFTSGSDRKSTRLNSSHVKISYAVFCL